jgi:hypothetical protein
MSTDELALLLEIRSELKALRVAMERPRGRGSDEAMIGLLRAIHDVMHADYQFTSGDLSEAAELPQFASLRAALGSSSPRRIGKLLHRIAGRNLDGMQLERADESRDGVLWVLRVCGS